MNNKINLVCIILILGVFLLCSCSNGGVDDKSIKPETSENSVQDESSAQKNTDNEHNYSSDNDCGTRDHKKSKKRKGKKAKKTTKP